MDTRTRNALLAALASAIVFDRLFWHHAIGINLSLFAALTVVLAVVGVGGRLSAAARLTAAGVVFSAGMLVLHGSTSACAALFACLFAFAGFVHAAELRSLLAAGLQWLLDTFSGPLAWLSALGHVLGRPRSLRTGLRWGRLVLLPLMVLVVYILLYSGGNSHFNAMTAGFFNDLGDLASRVLGDLFTPHTLFFLFGLLVCTGLLVRQANSIVRLEAGATDVLVRKRRRRPQWLAPLAMGALDRERRMGVVLLVLMNALLLVVNAVDIQWLWGGFTVPAHFDLKEFVHEGTWLLIISILLSIGILFYLFRRNLNFHPQARLLRILAVAWSAQNFVLGISVFLRNYHYIAFHGLAYLRIGVVVFLALVLVGLVTLVVKILRRKSFFYLLRVNGWAAFTALLVLAAVDWDSTIVRFNLHHWNSGEIDVDNYLAMSDKVLPQLYAELPRVDEQMRKHAQNEVRWVRHLDPIGFRRDLDRRRAAFLDRYARQDWQSWTWADARTYAALAQQGLAQAPPLNGPASTGPASEPAEGPTDTTH